MPKNRSRKSVREGVKYLRDKKGRFNGSIGNGRPLTTVGRKRQERIELERQRLRDELNPKQRGRVGVAKVKRLAKPDIPTEQQRYRETLDRLNAKGNLTTAEKFEKKLAEVRLQQLEPVPTPTREVKLQSVDKALRIPKTLNPQDQSRNTVLPPQTASAEGKTKLRVSKAGFNLDVYYNKTTSVELDPNFRYKVNHNGKELILNDNALTIRFKGEVVKGIPNVVADFKATDNTTLVDKIALAEVEVKKGRAPVWNVDEHGRIVDDDGLVGKSKKTGQVNYMGMQIHHVNQWALQPATEIEADFKAGKIDEKERERLYRQTIEPSTSKKKAVDYQIKLAPQGQREFVILPGGLHQGGTPLYIANHPYLYNPKQGKFSAIGIPDNGYGGREWFNTQYRGAFWKEYAKYQLSELTKEANQRIKSGSLSPEDAQALYASALDKIAKKKIRW